MTSCISHLSLQLWLLIFVAVTAAVPACGSADSSAETLAAASPTPDEVKVAQAGSQVFRGDTPARGGNNRCVGQNVRDTSAATAQMDEISICFAKAFSDGQSLDAEAKASLKAALMGRVEGALKGSAAASLGRAAERDALGLSGGSVTDASTPSSALSIFSPESCNFGSVVFSGNQLFFPTVGQPTSGGQAIFDMTYTSGAAKTRVTSADPTKATYQYISTGQTSTTSNFSLFVNEHRVRTLNATSEVELDVSTKTVDDSGLALASTNTPSSVDPPVLPVSLTYSLVSGTTRSTHNSAHFYADHTYEHLLRDVSGTCNCPVSGGLVQEVHADSGRVAVHTYTFSGCGPATVESAVTFEGATTHGRTSVSFDNCG